MQLWQFVYQANKIGKFKAAKLNSYGTLKNDIIQLKVP